MMDAFTPLPALIGGVLIGLASAVLWLGNGRIAGISGIFGHLLPPAAMNELGLVATERTIETPFGPVGPLALRRVPHGPSVWILPYTGSATRTDPRATIYAAHALGVRQIVAWDTVIALNPVLPRGQVAVMADYIDFTRGPGSFDGAPFNPDLVLVGTDHSPELYQFLARSGVPFELTWALDPDGHHHCVGFSNRLASLRITQHLLALWDDKERASGEVKRLASAHIDELNRKIAEMQGMVDTLSELVACCHGDLRPNCPILADLAGTEAGAGKAARKARA